jgi:transposase
MRKPITLRPLTLAEQQVLAAGLRSTSSFTLRRCQILLASQRGQQARQIADQLGCGEQTVRNALHEFHRRGLAALQPRPTVAHHRPHAVFDAARRERLRDLLHQSPRTFGYPSSLWTLPLVAQVAYAEGLTPRPVSGEAIRQALQHLRVGWKRAKHWITSPDPAYVKKKNSVTG